MSKSSPNHSTEQGTYRLWLHLYFIFLAAGTLFLLFAGAEVKSREAGLAVPDWPLSYGTWWPEMVGGIFYEHGHRTIAAIIGLITLVGTIFILCFEKRKWVRWLGLAALVAVFIQGMLGGLTVLMGLPAWVSTSHTLLGQSFFCITVALAAALSRSFINFELPDTATHSLKALAKIRTLAIAAAVLVVAQIFLGALMRHNEAGLAVTTLPLAYDQVFPALDEASLDGYMWEKMDRFAEREVEILRNETDALNVTATKVVLHMAHRFGAIVLAIALIAFTAYLFAIAKGNGIILTHAALIGFGIILQFILGLMVVISLKVPEIASLHLIGGALLYGFCVSLAVWTHRWYTVQAAQNSSSPVAEPGKMLADDDSAGIKSLQGGSPIAATS